MKSVVRNYLIAFGLFLCIIFIGTCTMSKQVEPPDYHPERDSIAILWKKEKEQLQVQYQNKITRLQSVKDSLQRIVKEKKKTLTLYRDKAGFLEDQLKAAIVIADSTYELKDSLLPLATSYFAAQAVNDSVCDSTIITLEQIVANRDSSIVLFKKAEVNMRDLQREQELRNQLLTEELNTAYKEQKKKVRQNKLLAAGLMFISGLTTTLLIKQSFK